MNSALSPRLWPPGNQDSQQFVSLLLFHTLIVRDRLFIRMAPWKVRAN
jgi:hypothetical protein